MVLAQPAATTQFSLLKGWVGAAEKFTGKWEVGKLYDWLRGRPRAVWMRLPRELWGVGTHHCKFPCVKKKSDRLKFDCPLWVVEKSPLTLHTFKAMPFSSFAREDEKTSRRISRITRGRRVQSCSEGAGSVKWKGANGIAPAIVVNHPPSPLRSRVNLLLGRRAPLSLCLQRGPSLL